jgi:phasin
MQTQNFEIPTELRDIAEKSVDQARNAVGAMMTNAHKAADQVQKGGLTLQATFQAAVAKGFDHAQANADAAFDHVQKLVRTKDLREAYELQTAYVRSQFSTLQAQAKEFGSLAQSAAR